MVMGCLVVSLSSGQIAWSQSVEQPNVVLIYIDDLGYGDVGCYGCPDIPTPNIDRLAREGVRCTASYITNPPCCPSRCSLMMGQYAQRFGKYGMSRGLPIPEDRPTLARWLTDHGYATGQIGKWDIGSKKQGPLAVGFTEVRRNPPRKRYSKEELDAAEPAVRKLAEKNRGLSKYYCIDEQGQPMWLTDYDGDCAVEFIERHRHQPFFLYWSPEAVHSPSAEVPERLMARTTANGKRSKLAGAIVSVDDQVGKILAALERLNLRQRTLVIFSSDNGANPGEGGSSAPYTGGKGEGTQKEGWVRVPTIMSMPGRVPEGAVYDGLVANFDFYATIAQLATGQVPAHCDGVDLLPHFRGQRTNPAHEYLFWLNNQPDDAPRRHLVAVRWQDWRLYRKHETDPWQLFDLATDPREEHNIASAHPDIVRRMADQHAAWKQTLAPLAAVPPPGREQPPVPPGHGWATATRPTHQSPSK
ncbi:MAG: hypothetical protein D6753_14655 [Planctomycetota bacterium]|nr:MAG: hypothetical protein D6753_14655 [Planctomycetota bacterium]